MRVGLFLLVFLLALPVHAADELTGDTRLACEAMLCLSSGVQPGECAPSLSRYFGINKKKWSDTLNARRAFLNLCPVSSDPGMPSLVEGIVNGAGRCNAELLNRVLSRDVVALECKDEGQFWNSDGERCREVIIKVIDDKLPSYCKAYTTHEWSWKLGVYYEGDKMHGGKWVDEQ